MTAKIALSAMVALIFLSSAALMAQVPQESTACDRATLLQCRDVVRFTTVQPIEGGFHLEGYAASNENIVKCLKALHRVAPACDSELVVSESAKETPEKRFVVNWTSEPRPTPTPIVPENRSLLLKQAIACFPKEKIQSGFDSNACEIHGRTELRNGREARTWLIFCHQAQATLVVEIDDETRACKTF